MSMLVEQLTENDSVSIVVYAGASGLVLPPTTGDRSAEILSALKRLSAGGSTNGGAGIELAYRTAKQHLIKDGINRVILATDGDFNVGTTNQGDLTRIIEEKASDGVFLSVLGFGMGNYKDSTLEKLADKGNGNYAYIDTLSEAKKVLVEQMSGTLVTIAKDVKIQVEFNPAQVAGYRLIGYENRLLRKEDFNDDTKDAGEIGAGHTVTALYEIAPAGGAVEIGTVDPLKYQQPESARKPGGSNETLNLMLRYKQPGGDVSRLIKMPFTDPEGSWESASVDMKFCSAVAAFGMLLRDSEFRGSSTFESVLSMAEAGRGDDRHGYRREFISLVEQARRISGQP
jgi:Ca-activated chloride channel family protein